MSPSARSIISLSQGLRRLGYCISVLLLASGAAVAQDASHGQQIFSRCLACHSNVASGPKKMGPNLAGVVGRGAGKLPGYTYSPAMAGQKFKWDSAHLDAFLAHPQQAVSGTKMPFGGMPDPKDRQDLIAYLKSLSAK